MFPHPTPIPTRPCTKCWTPVQVGRLVAGPDGEYGEDCAAKLGLTVTKPRLRADPQTGLSLLDLLDEEPEDECDGWDRT